MDIPRYRDTWNEDDPHANFKAEVANYSVADPIPTLETLSQATGIPVLSLIRYVLVKWVAAGAEAQLSMPPSVLRQMQAHVDAAEAAGTDETRLQAYESLRQMVAWLALPVEDGNIES